MPFIEQSSFTKPPLLHRGGHLQTILPSIGRNVKGIRYQRERMTLSDGDFLDLDWIQQQNERLLILTHGLEGNSTREYIKGMAKLFSEQGWDVLAWHCRSCSEEMNRAFKLYHHGDTADITELIDFSIKKYKYKKIALAGFSMGANISLKYLGTGGQNIPSEVQSCVVFSGPCALEGASDRLDEKQNWMYKRRFFKALSAKIRAKDKQYPNRLDVSLLDKVGDWRDFDEWFSAPMCGYRNADEFYEQSSSKNFVSGIRVPALLINAWNDPILTPACMPIKEAKASRYFYFEMPKEGGHCGFMERNQRYAWSELRALEFCSQ